MRKILVSLVAVTFALGMTVAAEAATVALWHFEEGSGTTAADSSGNGNDGTLMGSASWSTDSILGNYSVSLTGASGGFVQVPDDPSLDLVNAITIEAWVKPIELGVWRDFVFKGDAATCNYQFSMGFDGDQLAFDFYNAGWHTAYIDDAVVVGEWARFAVTYDRSNIKLYKNGVLLLTHADTTAMVANNLPLGIGAEGDGDQNFNGLIDYVRISDVALTPEEFTPIPEPATMILLGSGLLGLAALRRKRS